MKLPIDVFSGEVGSILFWIALVFIYMTEGIFFSLIALVVALAFGLILFGK